MTTKDIIDIRNILVKEHNYIADALNKYEADMKEKYGNEFWEHKATEQDKATKRRMEARYDHVKHVVNTFENNEWK